MKSGSFGRRDVLVLRSLRGGREDHWVPEGSKDWEVRMLGFQEGTVIAHQDVGFSYVDTPLVV